MKQEENNYNLMLTSLLIYFIECINCMNIQSKFEKDKPLTPWIPMKYLPQSLSIFSVFITVRGSYRQALM